MAGPPQPIYASHANASTGVRTDRLVIFHRSNGRDGQDLANASSPADVGPVPDDMLRLPTAGAVVVLDDQRVHPLVIDVIAIDDGDALAVQLGGGFILGVEDKQFAAGHAGADLVLDRAEDD